MLWATQLHPCETVAQEVRTSELRSSVQLCAALRGAAQLCAALRRSSQLCAALNRIV